MTENHEMLWDSDFVRLDLLLHEKLATGHKTDDKKDRSEVWFCKAYQRQEGCNIALPHTAWVSNQDKQVLHICAKCWLKEKTKRYHPEISQECPTKEL